MDLQKSAASRVRHILQAMERSIDTARTRRNTGNAATPNSTPANGMDLIGSPMPETVPHARPGMSPVPARLVGATPPTNPLAPNGALIGGSPANIRTPPAPVDPNQPARLKAKPKRFESTFAAQFAQNPYRSQAG